MSWLQGTARPAGKHVADNKVDSSCAVGDGASLKHHQASVVSVEKPHQGCQLGSRCSISDSPNSTLKAEISSAVTTTHSNKAVIAQKSYTCINLSDPISRVRPFSPDMRGYNSTQDLTYSLCRPLPKSLESRFEMASSLSSIKEPTGPLPTSTPSSLLGLQAAEHGDIRATCHIHCSSSA